MTSERKELRGVIERVRRGDCVLVLGPRVALRTNDPRRIPLDELLALELLATIEHDGPAQSGSPAHLRQAADIHYRIRHDREELELAVQDFYRGEGSSTTAFHRDLACLPFRLCIVASPDSLMLNALEEAGKSPRKAHYNFKQPTDERLSFARANTPLVYHLFGHYDDPRSLVLTEGDLVEFLVAIIRGVPPLPDQVRSFLADRDASFLFLGFGFHNWYLRVLLQVLNVYGHRSKAIAFEDEQFFSHPDHSQTISFFTGDRLIDFRPLRSDVFAHQLREAFEASEIARPAIGRSRESPSTNGPKVFVSYASEDHAAVEELANELSVRGIRVWQDTQDLRAGDDWNRVLLDVIKKRVDYVIVVQTRALTTAVRGVFRREIEVALERQSEMGEFDGQQLRFIVPVRIGTSTRLAALERFHDVDVKAQGGIDSLTKAVYEDWQKRVTLKSRQVA